MKYALIFNEVVVNIILWDGQTPYEPPAGDLLVEIVNDEVAIGWSYVDGQFIAPPEPEPEPILEQPQAEGMQTL